MLTQLVNEIIDSGGSGEALIRLVHLFGTLAGVSELPYPETRYIVSAPFIYHVVVLSSNARRGGKWKLHDDKH